MPGTSASSSTELNRPCAARQSTIFWAVTGPTPRQGVEGRHRGAVEVDALTGDAAARSAGPGRRPRCRSACRRGLRLPRSRHHDLFTVNHHPGEVDPCELGTRGGPAGGADGVLHPRSGVEPHHAGRLDLADDVHHDGSGGPRPTGAGPGGARRAGPRGTRTPRRWDGPGAGPSAGRRGGRHGRRSRRGRGTPGPDGQHRHHRQPDQRQPQHGTPRRTQSDLVKGTGQRQPRRRRPLSAAMARRCQEAFPAPALDRPRGRRDVPLISASSRARAPDRSRAADPAPAWCRGQASPRVRPGRRDRRRRDRRGGSCRARLDVRLGLLPYAATRWPAPQQRRDAVGRRRRR